MTRTITEYRVLSQRGENAVTDKRYRSLKTVQKRIGLLTADEPWRFYGDRQAREKGPNDYACCSGRECGCGGLTMREETDQRRKDLPPIVSVRVEVRQITSTKWEPVTPPGPHEDGEE